MFNHKEIPLHWINRLSFLSRRMLAGRFKEAGLSISAEEWAVLLMLWRQDGLGPGEVSANSLRDPTTVTRLIDGMVRKGLVERREGVRDRRRSEVWLTEAGRAARALLMGVAVPVIQSAQQGISPDELAITLKVLRQMTENLLDEEDVKES